MSCVGEVVNLLWLPRMQSFAVIANSRAITGRFQLFREGNRITSKIERFERGISLVWDSERQSEIPSVTGIRQNLKPR